MCNVDLPNYDEERQRSTPVRAVFFMLGRSAVPLVLRMAFLRRFQSPRTSDFHPQSRRTSLSVPVVSANHFSTPFRLACKPHVVFRNYGMAQVLTHILLTIRWNFVASVDLFRLADGAK